MASIRERAEQLTQRTTDAYSFDKYSRVSWRACCALLLRRGYSDKVVEQIMRSRWPRAAADFSAGRDGLTTSAGFARYLENTPWPSKP